VDRRAYLPIGKLAGYLLIPAALVFIPTSWLERHPAPCLFRLLFKRNCPACGMTRALSSAAHGHWRPALRHNPLVIVVLPLGILAWASGVAAVCREVRGRASWSL
jgi:hypothetical protein